MSRLPHDRRAFLTHTMGALAGFAVLPAAHDLWPSLQATRVRVALVGAGRQGRAILTELQKF